MRKHPSSMMAVLAILMLIVVACTTPAASEPAEESEPAASEPMASEPAESEPAASEPATGIEACGEPESGDALQIGVVTDVGQLEDKSFNEASWCGAIAGATSVGGTAEVIVTEAPADYAQNIQTFVDRDFDVIVTVGFAIGDATKAAAEENPETWFLGVDQFIADPIPDNYMGLLYNEAQAGYLAGIVAANITETDVIGAVGGIASVPPVVNYISGYANGAASVNPDIEVLIEYVSTDITVAFNDPATGKSIGEQMIGADADVLFQVAGLSGQGTIEAACDAGVYGIGVDVDQYFSLPDLQQCIVTSAEKKLKESVQAAIERVAGVADDSAESGNIFHDAAADPPGVGLSPFHDFEDELDPSVQEAVDEAFDALADGSIDPCEGPTPCFGG
jgi:basic membrane protein A and related proteins